MPGMRARRVAGTGMALGAAAGLLAGCYTGEFPNIDETVLHQSEQQVAVIRNPFPDELKILEPYEADPALWDQLNRLRDDWKDTTTIHVPPGGTHRLPFHVVTVADGPEAEDEAMQELVLPADYVREDKGEHDPSYLVQQGSTVRLRIQHGEAPPTEVLLSLNGCKDHSWSDGPAPQATHVITADQPVPYLPQTLCPRG